jgi:transcriptional regulator with XRE-family HTH domain
MNWKSLIQDLRNAGMSQAEIGKALGKSQGWVSAVMADGYADLKWGDGEALRRLHAEKLGAGETALHEQKAA